MSVGVDIPGRSVPVLGVHLMVMFIPEVTPSISIPFIASCCTQKASRHLTVSIVYLGHDVGAEEPAGRFGIQLLLAHR